MALPLSGTLPLAGTTVVSIEQAVAAPFATRQLADLGAQVIKVERPGTGDFARGYDESILGQSSYFVWLNRSKESLSCDLKSAEGREVVRLLLADADVFVQNLAPGAARRLGLDAATLQAEHPRLIVCDVTGFGSTGPWQDAKAYDLLVQCETGLVSLTGSPDSPAKAGISVADIAAGMYAFSGILTALLQRAATGVAPALEVSLFEALAEWMGSPMYYTEGLGRQPQRVGIEHATIAPYGPYTAADGDALLVGIQNDREWRAFCRVILEDPDVAVDPRFARNSDRVAHRPELNAVIAKRFAALPEPAASRLLSEADIAHARVNQVQGLLDHPVLEGRDRWRQIDTPGGPVRALLPPISIRGVVPRMDPVPAVGEHTDPILASLGYDEERIVRLRQEGAV
jgi:crotonobetainyl-CoA:carnitine CoA-transferase CaiB-like acyl-CoA transferase